MPELESHEDAPTAGTALAEDTDAHAWATFVREELDGLEIWLRDELQQLRALTDNDENVVALADARFYTRRGLLALTDRRLVFSSLQRSASGKGLEEFALADVCNVQAGDAVLVVALRNGTEVEQVQFDTLRRADGAHALAELIAALTRTGVVDLSPPALQAQPDEVEEPVQTAAAPEVRPSAPAVEPIVAPVPVAIDVNEIVTQVRAGLLAGITEQLAAADQRAEAATGELAGKLAALEQHVGAAFEHAKAAAVEREVQFMAALDRAAKDTRKRLTELERNAREQSESVPSQLASAAAEQLASLEEHLTALVQADKATDRSDGQAPAESMSELLGPVQQRLDQLAAETEQFRALVEAATQAAVVQLRERLDELELGNMEQSEGLPARMAAVATEQLTRPLTLFQERLELDAAATAETRERVDQLAAAVAAQTKAMHAELATTRQRVDYVADATAQRLTSLVGEAVTGLVSDVISPVQQRLDAITGEAAQARERLDALAAAGAAHTTALEEHARQTQTVLEVVTEAGVAKLRERLDELELTSMEQSEALPGRVAAAAGEQLAELTKTVRHEFASTRKKLVAATEATATQLATAQQRIDDAAAATADAQKRIELIAASTETATNTLRTELTATTERMDATAQANAAQTQQGIQRIEQIAASTETATNTLRTELTAATERMDATAQANAAQTQHGLERIEQIAANTETATSTLRTELTATTERMDATAQATAAQTQQGIQRIEQIAASTETATNTVRTELTERMDATAQATTAAVQQATEQIAASTETQTKALRTELTAATERMDAAAQANAAQTQHGLERIEQIAASTETATSTLRAELTATTERMDAAAQATAAQLDLLELAAQQHAEELPKQLAVQTERFAALEQGLGALAAQAGADAAVRQVQVEGIAQTVADEVGAMRSRFDTLDARWADEGARRQAIADRLDTVEQRFTTVTSQTDAQTEQLVTRLEELAQRLTSDEAARSKVLGEAIDMVSDNVAALGQRLTALTEQVHRIEALADRPVVQVKAAAEAAPVAEQAIDASHLNPAEVVPEPAADPALLHGHGTTVNLLPPVAMQARPTTDVPSDEAESASEAGVTIRRWRRVRERPDFWSVAVDGAAHPPIRSRLTAAEDEAASESEDGSNS